jgi:hypothetical protein
MEEGRIVEVIATIKLDSGFPSAFYKSVVKEIAYIMKKEAEKIKVIITDQLRKTVRDSLVATPEYQSIVQGKLRAELGIPNSQSRIIEVIDTWINNMVVTVKASNNPFLQIEIGMIQGDYGDVLALPAAQYTYSSRRGGGTIPWLKWLLLEGDKRIITKYEFSNNPRGSRTGMGIMISKAKGAWQVPPEFSGTSVDNFATRALDGIENKIDKIVETTIKGRLK